MSKALPYHPHLDSLKKQAKQLFKAHQSAQPEAADRIRVYMPHLRPLSHADIFAADFTLQTAQCVLAREYGFANWSALVEGVGLIRQTEVALLGAVEERLAQGQAIHVIVPERTIPMVLGTLVERFGRERVLVILSENQDGLATWLARLEEAPIVLCCSDTMGFIHMREKLAKPEGPWQSTALFTRTYAFVSEPHRNAISPLIIAGEDVEKGGTKELASMYLTELYALYESVSDYRY